MARVFSGIQPSGEMHLGNYLGAVRNWVRDQADNECLYCVVDLHAMTLPYDATGLAGRTLNTMALLVAAGLDPDRCTLFVQSHVHEHSELTWILECTATMGELNRMTQFKDKGRGQESVAAALLTYPVLQAADVLLYDTERVPVGDDQRQHIELARDIANRFNHRYGPTFVVPEHVIPTAGARVMDLQNPSSKMSKTVESPQGTVGLLDDPKVITKKFRSAVTDSGTEIRYDPAEKPGVSNLLSILAAVTDRTVEDLAAEYDGGGYGTFKAAVADAVVEFLRPLQERHAALVADEGELRRIVGQGADKARAVAVPVMARARTAAGLLPRS
jgi:tryptophanyl-tRNA synthetase